MSQQVQESELFAIVQATKVRLEQALQQEGELARQAGCLAAFAALVEALEPPDEAAWAGAGEPARRQWLAALAQLAAAGQFLLAALDEPDRVCASLAGRVGELQLERAQLLARRDELSSKLTVAEVDVEQLREEVALLEALLPYAALCRLLRERQAEEQPRRAANARLAAAARQASGQLQALDASIEEAEARREEILRRNLEQDDAWWEAVRHALR
ncbi:MAG: hypothetical protein FJ125_06220 [Deltaproteobacteria bacterium]|nr:hypothetical protein [Deltaproteobacteria bacterium]